MLVRGGFVNRGGMKYLVAGTVELAGIWTNIAGHGNSLGVARSIELREIYLVASSCAAGKI